MITHDPVLSLEALLLWNAAATVMLWYLLRILFAWFAQAIFGNNPDDLTKE